MKCYIKMTYFRYILSKLNSESPLVWSFKEHEIVHGFGDGRKMSIMHIEFLLVSLLLTNFVTNHFVRKTI